MKKIGVLTSSRADYSIYLPLLKRLKQESNFSLKIIAFGSHLSPYHAYTVDIIKNDGFQVEHEVFSLLLHDNENAISTAVGLTIIKFSDFWNAYKAEFDLVFCLGDRYEMFAAVYAGLPFGIRFAHIHGGETTLGAIDNVYRHAISLASSYHFVATDMYMKRVVEITGSDQVYIVGSLSLDNVKEISILSIEEIIARWSIDFSLPTILITVHPETVESAANSKYAKVCYEVFKILQNKYQLVITMPNVDTLGSVFRNSFSTLGREFPRTVKIVENFGVEGYFSAMKYSKFLLGNTSSGIIEAASFNKYVLNLGNRQEGRATSQNVFNCRFISEEILKMTETVSSLGDFQGKNIYDNGGAAIKIIQVLNSL